MFARSDAADADDPTRPLAGVKVLDLTSVIMGPYATQIMADLGATIIKVESPEGDTTRYVGAGSGSGMSGTYLNLNRNKQGICLDLKRPAALSALKQMISKADIFMHSMRAEAIARLGLSYPDVAEVNEAIIYVNGWGFGRNGLYQHKPSLDDIIQAAAGIVGLVEEATGTASYVPTVLADKISGLTILYSVLAALYRRQVTGKGVEIEVPMFEATVSFLLCEHASDAIFDPPHGRPVYPKSVSRAHKPFATLDGRISVVLYSDKHWESFGKLVGSPDLLTRPAFASLAQRVRNTAETYAFVAEKLKLRVTDEWLRLFDEVGIPAMPVQTIDELYQDPHLQAVGFFQHVDHGQSLRACYPSTPVRYDGHMPAVTTRAPGLGQHNREVLGGFGFAEEEIATLEASGALFSRDAG